METYTIKVATTDETFYNIVDKLENNKRCIYSRFGDGDIYVMMGRDDSFTKYSDKLKNEMLEAFSLISDDYLKGLAVDYKKESGMYEGVFAPHNTNETLLNWLNKNFNYQNQYQYHNALTYHYFSVFKQEEMVNFLEKYIRNKRIMFIGSIPKNSIERLLGPISVYIKTPPRDAYYTMDDWYPEIERNIDKVDICIPAAGLATRIINKNLLKLDNNVKSLDIGSIVDAVDKRSTRTWITKEGDKINNILIK